MLTVCPSTSPPTICILIVYRGNGHRGLHLHAGLQEHVQLRSNLLRLQMVRPRGYPPHYGDHR
jgi:hypothetical protein